MRVGDDGGTGRRTSGDQGMCRMRCGRMRSEVGVVVVGVVRQSLATVIGEVGVGRGRLDKRRKGGWIEGEEEGGSAGIMVQSNDEKQVE